MIDRYKTIDYIIDDSAKLHNEAFLEAPVRVYDLVLIDKNTKIGSFSYINRATTVFNGTEIGRYCSIGKYCELGVIDHPLDWLSTSPFQYKIEKQFPNYEKYVKDFPQLKMKYPKKTIIGNDVWIGSYVVIKRGVRIGDGAVIGAGAVVLDDVPPYAIVVGVPGKVIKYRFTKEQIDKLLKIKWWNFPIDRLKGIRFNNIDIAITSLENIKNSISFPDELS